MNKRKIILNLAMSLDWYIADENWLFDWILGDWDKTQDTEAKMDFNGFMETVDTLVMWRKAYDDCPKETMDTFKDKKIYVATHSEIEDIPENVTCIKWDISKQILEEQKQEWKNIYLWWGAVVADDFIKSDVIDEYIIGIVPTILGKWRPLFFLKNFLVKVLFFCWGSSIVGILENMLVYSFGRLIYCSILFFHIYLFKSNLIFSSFSIYFTNSSQHLNTTL